MYESISEWIQAEDEYNKLTLEQITSMSAYVGLNEHRVTSMVHNFIKNGYIKQLKYGIHERQPHGLKLGHGL